MIEHVYTYEYFSGLHGAPAAPTLSLASDRTVSANQPFLRARATDPVITAKSLRAVSEIVGSRFYVPPSMLAKILREADPVVTVGGDAVRFEGFSACCSAYIRLDLDDTALDVEQRGKGTTNVDFGAELRGALASVARNTELGITVGADAVAIEKNGDAIVEKKVPLPLRWIKGFEPLVNLADSLGVHINPTTGATSWALDFGSQRLWLVLNAEPWRGFSGDGGLLERLATADETGIATVTAELNWQDRVDPVELSTRTGLAPDTVKAALSRLAATGRVGYDLERAGFFHRDLPFDLSDVQRLNPRLKSAMALCEAGAVRRNGSGADVVTEDVTHRVNLAEGDGGWRCTCPWFAKNGTQRGPCKHILATELDLEKIA